MFSVGPVVRVGVENHSRDQRVQEIETRLVVDVDACVELLEREVGEQLWHRRACAAEDNVRVDHLFAQKVPELQHLLGVRQVDGVGDGKLVVMAFVVLVSGCNLVELVLGPCQEHKACSAVVQLVCQRPAQSLRRPGHDDDLVEHFKSHCLSAEETRPQGKSEKPEKCTRSKANKKQDIEKKHVEIEN